MGISRLINWQGMLIGLGEIIDGIFRLFSLGHIHLNLSFKIIFWIPMYNVEKARKDAERKTDKMA